MLKLKTAFVLIISAMLSSTGCQNNSTKGSPDINNPAVSTVLREGPNSTGALKEGPNSTGALKEKSLLLTQKINGIENPLTPENINSIEIISRDSNQTIKTIDIVQNKKLFTVKSGAIEITVLFEGSGNFVIKFNQDVKDLILKFNLKNFSVPAIIPLFNGLTENNLRSGIESRADGRLIIHGGTKKAEGDIDPAKAVFTVQPGADGDTIITFIRRPEGPREIYLLSKAEASIKNGETVKPDGTEQITEPAVEKQKIESQVDKLSSIAGFVGEWVFQGMGKELNLNIIDQGNGNFSGNFIISPENYGGTGKYLAGSLNDFLFITSSHNGSPLKIKIWPLSPNTLGFTLTDTTDRELLIYRGITLTLNRKLN